MQDQAGEAATPAGRSATHRRASRKQRRGVSLATRLAGAAVGVSFAALAAATAVGVNSGVTLGEDIYQRRLVSLGNSGADDVGVALRSSATALEVRAASPATVSALEQFEDAFADLTPPEGFVPAAERRALIDAYRTQYATGLERAGGDVSLQSVVSNDARAVYLQSRYSVSDEAPAQLEDADDGTAWSAVHATYHSSFRRLVTELGLVDFYLIEPVEERVVYSVAKGIDLGTSLSAGPFSGSVLANTVSQVFEADDPAPALSDLAFYDGTPGSIVGVVAAPVFDGGRLVGVAAATFDGAAPTEVMTNDGNWESAGFDASSDRYLVGNDGTLRSDPRPFLEDPRAFLDAAEAAGGLTTDERARIERLGTTVLTLFAVDATLATGEAGEVDGGTAIDGTEVVSATTPVELGLDELAPDLGWTVVTEIDLAEAETALDDFRNILVVGTAVFLIVVAFAAVWWANRTMAPVRTVSDRLGDPERDAGPLAIPASSPLEFHYLVASFQRMARSLTDQHRQLVLARDERLRLMRQMLPPAVAERAAAGDLDELDEIGQTSVVVVVVLGLSELVESSGPSGRRVVEGLHAELDGLAESHGLDRIKVVGDAYFASCGHDRPYLDHAPRAVSFAADARDAVDALAADDRLTAAIGVHTGPVTIGMIGGERMIFDVWGDTVSYAHLLARRATGNEVLLSDEVHDYLPEEMVAEATTIDDVTVWALPLSTVGSRG